VLFVEELRGIVPWTEAQVASGREGVPFRLVRGIAGHEFIACDLFMEESVEGFILFERADHIVAEAPCLRAEFIPVVAIAVAVADRIEPESGEVFRGGAGRQEGSGRFLRGNADGLRRRRESGQGKVEAADERAFVSLRGRRQIFLREPVQNEEIDGIARP